jgi:hypothetical protein
VNLYKDRVHSTQTVKWVQHLLYILTVAQLNDPTDCRPRIKPMSEEEMVTFLRNDYIRRNPVLALDLLQKHEALIRERIRSSVWSGSCGSSQKS